MSAKSHKLIVSNPCSNDWNEMLPVQNGKHCNSCNKNVVDFSIMNDNEVIQFFINNKDKPVCGRFYKNQINTIRIEINENLLFSDIIFWKKFLIIFCICFGYQLFSVQFIFSQNTNDTFIQNNVDTIITEIDTLEKNIPNSFTDTDTQQILNIDSNTVFDIKPAIIDFSKFEGYIFGFTTTQPVETSIIMGDVCTQNPNSEKHFLSDNRFSKKSKENKSITTQQRNNDGNNKSPAKKNDNKSEMMLTNTAFQFGRKKKKKNNN